MVFEGNRELPLTLFSSDLKEMKLYGNADITGSIPSELGKLSKLTQFSANNTSLTGSVPFEFGALAEHAKLVTFQVTYSSFLGTVPPSLCGIESFFVDCVVSVQCACNCNDNCSGGTLPPA